MFRTSLWCAAALVLLPPACRAEQTVTPTETVIKLTVSPMAAPRPALRYQLLPELKEMQPGNPIPNYLKCFLDQDFTQVQEVLGSDALRQADRAARLDKPDWQILLKIKTDGVGLLLPDVQKLRSLASALQERFRQEAALRRFDDGLNTAKTMFAMSRHMGEHPTLIGDLVGIAIANVAISPLEDMLEQPGCPNLYWALTNLPSPLISLERGLEGERVLIRGEFSDLDDVTPMNPEQIRKLIDHIDKIQFDASPVKPGQGARGYLDARVGHEDLLRAARARLIEAGLPEERLLRFPPDQVFLLDERLEYEVRRDEVAKLMRLPYWQIDARIDSTKPARPPGLFGILVPALLKVRQAQSRLEQRVALLRHVEALRLYAAAHDGKLPEKLADILEPLPDDPFTGKPFRYKVEGNTAHLMGSPPRGLEKNPAYNVRYEVTVRK